MSWRDLLEPAPFCAPWFGCPVHGRGRVWRVRHAPKEHGWWWWRPEGRYITPIKPGEQDYEWAGSRQIVEGHVVDVYFFGQSYKVARLYCAPPCERFERVSAVVTDGHLVYWQPSFSENASESARHAFEDRRALEAPGVTPELRDAFDWAVQQRERAEETVRQREYRRAWMAATANDTALDRRRLVGIDVAEAASRALRVSGAELLDIRDIGDNYVVRYRCRDRRLECVVDKNLRVVDSGVCLTDEETGVKYDSLLTLESLPGVIGEAIDRDVLVVWRHG